MKALTNSAPGEFKTTAFGLVLRDAKTTVIKCVFIPVLAVVLSTIDSASAQIPALMNYQGRLLDGTNLYTGSAALSLRLYNASAAGTLLYEDSNLVTVVDGLYSTIIGDQTNSGNFAQALTNAQVWLEVVFSNTPLSPRERILSSAYSIIAGGVSRSAITAEMLAPGSVTVAALATGSVTTAALASNSVTSAQLAPGSVGASDLARMYQSGSIAFPDFSFVSQTNFSVNFPIPFATPPSVTLTLSATSSAMVAGTRLVVTSVTTTNFTGFCRLPVTINQITDRTIAGFNGALENVGGLPAIAFIDANGAVRYSRALDENGAAWSYPGVLDSNAWGNVAIGMVNGAPAIAYMARPQGTSNVYQLRYNRADSVSAVFWTNKQTIDVFTNTSLPQVSCSLAVVASNPAVSYIWDPTGGTSNNLRFIRAADTNGTTWSAAPVSLDWVGVIESYASLRVINTNPAVAYYDSTVNDLCYLRASNDTGSAWSSRKTVVSTGLVGYFASLEAVNGQPAIGYQDQTSGSKLFFVRATDAAGATWGSPVGVDTGAFESTGFDCVLRVIGGKPAMAYQHLTTRDLRYAQAVDANGASWGTPVTVDSLGDTGQYASLLNFSNRAAIASYDAAQSRQTFVLDQQEPFTVNWIAVE